MWLRGEERRGEGEAMNIYPCSLPCGLVEHVMRGLRKVEKGERGLGTV
jgi:hypothetical protein